MAIQSCPKCDGTMQEGFVLDLTQNAYRRAEWVEGAPEKSFWFGLKLRGRARRPITAWRCLHCGYIESYAKGR